MQPFKSNRADFTRILQSALKLDVPYHDHVPRDLFSVDGIKSTPAAVLILFVFSRIQTSLAENGPTLLFIRRTEEVLTHKGQMAFPGGHCNCEDLGDPIATAIRENAEEVGIPPADVHILGLLPSLTTVTGFLIHPVVGLFKGDLEDITLHLDLSEIAEAVWVPLQVLLLPETYRQEMISIGKAQYPTDVFQVKHHRIWGATGAMMKNLLDRIKILS